MDNHQFDALVRRLEPRAAAAPRLYQARVFLLALLGYAYIGAVLLALLGLVGLCFWYAVTAKSGRAGLMKIAIALLVLAGVVARAMWVRFEPPEGRRLTREDAPRLFEEAETLRRKLRAPRAHTVLLNDEYNASVTQIPRLGILGWPRNYLVVGLQLLETLPAEQVRAVLAHEFAHLSSAHGAFASWIYRVRMSWYQLMQRLDESRSMVTFVFRWFFDWYAPYFGAYTFVLMRRHEYEADRLAADVVGRTRMAQTLVDLEVRGAFLGDRFWPRLWREVETRITPPDDVYTRLATAARTPLPEGEVHDWLAVALRGRTDTTDTHPSLRDRVAALVGQPDAEGRLPSGATLCASSVFSAPAADYYFGLSHAPIAQEIGGLWSLACREPWTQRRDRLREATEELVRLEREQQARSLTLEERWQLACLTEEVRDAEAAFPIYERLLREHPEHLSAAFAVGRLQLRRDDAAGLALLERVMARDEDAIIPCCQLACAFFARAGRHEEADRYRDRAIARNADLEEADRELRFLSAGDELAPASLSREVLDAIVAQLDRIEGVHRAYLARKVLRQSNGASIHVLVVVPTPAYLWAEYRIDNQRKRAEAIARQVEVPDDVAVYAFGDAGDPVLKPIRRLAGALFYESKRRRNQRRAAKGRTSRAA